MALALPKPVRPAKARTYLRRSRQPIARRAPIARSSSRPSPMRQSETAELEREAQRLAGRICEKRAGGWCEICRWIDRVLRQGCDPMHVLAKGAFPNIRFDVENLIWGCRGHHEQLRSATLDESEPSPMRVAYIRLRGREAWNRLVLRARLVKTFRPEVVAELRGLAAELGA
jgi:hypothetical protein